MMDPIERGEARAEAWFDELSLPGGLMKCPGCDAPFDPDKEGGTLSPDPYAPPYCGGCCIEHEENQLASIILEGEQIVARHDGVHNAHGALSNLTCWMRNLKEGVEVNWPNVHDTIRALRIVDKTGVYPKKP